MAIFVVEYVYDSARADEVGVVRPRHREFLAALHEEGVNLASGPWTEGEAGALLLIRADSAEGALAALDADPLHEAGLIARRTARGWDPVIGAVA